MSFFNNTCGISEAQLKSFRDKSTALETFNKEMSLRSNYVCMQQTSHLVYRFIGVGNKQAQGKPRHQPKASDLQTCCVFY